MRIIDARWDPTCNILTILCKCGRQVLHRADRWMVRCPCGHSENLHVIRERYVSDENEVNLVDPKITVSTEATSKATGKVYTAQYQVENSQIERNVMDEIQKLVGDGKARVTVSADFGIKEFGTGASAMCSVSLSCNQDIKTIEQAAKFAGDLARDIAQEQRARAAMELEAVMGSNRG